MCFGNFPCPFLFGCKEPELSLQGVSPYSTFLFYRSGCESRSSPSSWCGIQMLYALWKHVPLNYSLERRETLPLVLTWWDSQLLSSQIIRTYQRHTNSVQAQVVSHDGLNPSSEPTCVIPQRVQLVNTLAHLSLKQCAKRGGQNWLQN